MPKRTGSSNQDLQKMIADMRNRGHKEKSGFLIKVADELSKPSRQRAEANISRLERACAAKEDVMIPGKLLSDGILTKPLTVACLSASEAARKKVESAGGKIISIGQMAEKNPKGTGVRIVC